MKKGTTRVFKKDWTEEPDKTFSLNLPYLSLRSTPHSFVRFPISIPSRFLHRIPCRRLGRLRERTSYTLGTGSCGRFGSDGQISRGFTFGQVVEVFGSVPDNVTLKRTDRYFSVKSGRSSLFTRVRYRRMSVCVGSLVTNLPNQGEDRLGTRGPV